MPSGSASKFVDSLVRLASVVLFAAAIPGQGGIMHVNEQWPGYWVSLFSQHGYTAIDAIRPLVWDNDDVEWWYAQNTLLFVDSVKRAEAIRKDLNRSNVSESRALVHPRLYDGLRRAQADETLRQLLRRFPGAMRRSIDWHMLRSRW